jgi:hypothetical protein
MGPAFRMAGALLGIGQAGVGQAQQRSVRLLVDRLSGHACYALISRPHAERHHAAEKSIFRLHDHVYAV